MDIIEDYKEFIEKLSNLEIISYESHHEKLENDEKFFNFLNMLKSNNTIKSVTIKYDYFTHTMLGAISDVLVHNKIITCLNLYCKTKIHYFNLNECLKLNETISTFILTQGGINKENIKPFVNGLITPNLVHLNLAYNEIDDEVAKIVSEILIYNKIEILNLKKNCIFNEGVISLSNALCKNTSLKHLNLESNGIGTIGFVALSNALKVNESLISLNLNNVSVKIFNFGADDIKPDNVDAIQALTDALIHNNSLEILLLDNNMIGPNCVALIIKMLNQNKTIKLTLNDNSIEKEEREEIEKLLKERCLGN